MKYFDSSLEGVIKLLWEIGTISYNLKNYYNNSDDAK